jgi:hypothetical protein
MAVSIKGALGGSGIGDSDLFSIDPSTVATASIGDTGFALTGIAIDPTSGLAYGVTSAGSTAHPKSLIGLDLLTGAGTFIALLGSGHVIPDIDFDSTGQMYGWDNTSGVLVKINKTTGALTNLGASGIPGSKVGSGIAIDSTDVCYLFPKGSTSNYYIMDLTTGAGTLAGSLDGSGSGNTITAASFDDDDTLWAFNGDGSSVTQLDTIDVGTGVKTLIGTMATHGGNWDALLATGSAVAGGIVYTDSAVVSSVTHVSGGETQIHTSGFYGFSDDDNGII